MIYFVPERFKLIMKNMVYRVQTISELHEIAGFEKPKHPLVTVIDYYSHDLIISNIELLLNYCRRFYGRQFITRTNQNKDVIVRFEEFIMDYFNSHKLKNNGIPTVKHCADAMNLSPNYFSDLLKSETGRNTQEHIHYHLLEKAKNILISSNKSINEIAYELGFEYPQSFCKFFKKKVGVPPTVFRVA